MVRYYFYIEWTFKATPAGLESPGPYHTRLITDCPELTFDWKRLKDLKVISFETREEAQAYWTAKTQSE